MIDVCTYNTNSYGTWLDAMVEFRHTDVLLVQEHKLMKELLNNYQNKFRKLGWKVYMHPCILGPFKGASSGVAILVRPNLDSFSWDDVAFPITVSVIEE